MTNTKSDNIENTYKIIKLLSNRKKFEIIKATQENRKNITELSKELKLAYNKCSDYVASLEKENLILKERDGKEVYVKSKITLSKNLYSQEKII